MEKYQIFYGNQTFEATEQQCHIFDFIEHGQGNILINACAGSSKTTTILNALRYIRNDKNVLFVAFNKSIVDTINQKFITEGHKLSAKITTFHALGYGLVLKHLSLENKDINEYKYINYINNNLLNKDYFYNNVINKKHRKLYIDNIIKLIDLSRQNLKYTVKEISILAKKINLLIIGNECELVHEALKWGKENYSEIDYTDMVWLPNILNLSVLGGYDWIFVDEVQDMSIAEYELINKFIKKGTRICFVGDEHQAINQFAGSTTEIIKKFNKDSKTKTFGLTISFRCPKNHVLFVKNNNYCKTIEYADNAIFGEINNKVPEFAPKNDDMVLCRTTAPLIKLHLKYLERNKKSHINGWSSIKKEFDDIIDRFEYTNENLDINRIDKNSFFSNIDKEYVKCVKNKMEINEISLDSAIMSDECMRVFDNILALQVLSKNLSTKHELKEKIDAIFNDVAMNESNDESIVLSTIHKAKGMERDNVFILNKSDLDRFLHNAIDSETDYEMENNVHYVAYTRAKKTLNFIKEDTYNSPKTKELSLSNMKNFFNKVIEREGIEFSDTYKNDCTDVKTEVITETKVHTEQPKIDKNKKIGGLKFKNLL